jgi:hypothetical protein
MSAVLVTLPIAVAVRWAWTDEEPLITDLNQRVRQSTAAAGKKKPNVALSAALPGSWHVNVMPVRGLLGCRLVCNMGFQILSIN